jgi:hypothetical protein
MPLLQAAGPSLAGRRTVDVAAGDLPRCPRDPVRCRIDRAALLDRGKACRKKHSGHFGRNAREPNAGYAGDRESKQTPYPPGGRGADNGWMRIVQSVSLHDFADLMKAASRIQDAKRASIDGRARRSLRRSRSALPSIRTSGWTWITCATAVPRIEASRTSSPTTRSSLLPATAREVPAASPSLSQLSSSETAAERMAGVPAKLPARSSVGPSGRTGTNRTCIERCCEASQSPATIETSAQRSRSTSAAGTFASAATCGMYTKMRDYVESLSSIYRTSGPRASGRRVAADDLVCSRGTPGSRLADGVNRSAAACIRWTRASGGRVRTFGSRSVPVIDAASGTASTSR